MRAEVDPLEALTQSVPGDPSPGMVRTYYPVPRASPKLDGLPSRQARSAPPSTSRSPARRPQSSPAMSRSAREQAGCDFDSTPARRRTAWRGARRAVVAAGWLRVPGRAARRLLAAGRVPIVAERLISSSARSASAWPVSHIGICGSSRHPPRAAPASSSSRRGRCRCRPVRRSSLCRPNSRCRCRRVSIPRWSLAPRSSPPAASRSPRSSDRASCGSSACPIRGRCGACA